MERLIWPLIFRRRRRLRLAGYSVEGVHGDYDLGPLTGESMQMVVIGAAGVGAEGGHAAP